MANQQLVDYIKSQLAAGVAKPEIQKTAAAASWPLPEIDAAFAAAEGKSATPPAPQPPVVAKPQPAVVPQTQPLPVIHMHPPGGILRSWWLWTLIILILLIAMGAAAYTLTPIKGIVSMYLNPPAPAPAATTTPQITEQTYTDQVYGFSLTYPGSLVPLPTGPDEVLTFSNFSAEATTSPALVASCMPRTPAIATTTIGGAVFAMQTATSTASTTVQVYTASHVGACITLKGFDMSATPIIQSFRLVATSTPAATSTTVTP